MFGPPVLCLEIHPLTDGVLFLGDDVVVRGEWVSVAPGLLDYTSITTDPRRFRWLYCGTVRCWRNKAHGTIQTVFLALVNASRGGGAYPLRERICETCIQWHIILERQCVCVLAVGLLAV